MNIGENIKNARKSVGIRQIELADKLGVYQKDISRWENGQTIPNSLTLAEICKALGVSADEILELK